MRNSAELESEVLPYFHSVSKSRSLSLVKIIRLNLTGRGPTWLDDGLARGKEF
jgi:hypothetical protein